MGRVRAADRAEQAPGGDLFGWGGDPGKADAPPPAAQPAPVAEAFAMPPRPAALPANPPPPQGTERASLPPQMPVARAAERTASRATLYIVQPYADRAAGKGAPRWRAGTASSFTDPNRALRAADACIGKGGTVGAFVARQTAEPDLGEWSEPEIIGRFGRVPELED
jgi:hypothetical protein